MIVRNEAHIIERGLTAVLPFVDEWCIVDTGSTDDTQAIIRRTCVGKPGEVVNEPWQDFGYNRSHALAQARALHPTCKWQLMLDADDIFRYTPDPAARPGDPRPPIMPDVAYTSGLVAVHIGDVVTVRPQVFSSAHPWMYKGKLHEYADLPGPMRAAHVAVNPCYWIDARTEGARSKNPNKYADDAKLLEGIIADNPTDYRSLFYAAQSWRDANEPFRAYCLYKKLAHCKDAWTQERYVSCTHIVNSAAVETDEAAFYAGLAMELVPWRCEATIALLRRARFANKWRHQYHALAKYNLEAVEATPKALRDTGLFIVPSAYTFELLDEMGVLAFHLGRYAECVKYSLRAMDGAPQEERARLQGNVDASRARLLMAPSSGDFAWLSGADAATATAGGGGGGGGGGEAGGPSVLYNIQAPLSQVG